MTSAPSAGNHTTSWAISLAMLCLLCSAAWWVEQPYFDIPLVSDDQIHLDRLVQMRRGERSAFEFFFKPHNVHLIPLWKAWFYACWAGGGMNPRVWHASIALWHAGCGWLLFLLARRHGLSFVAASAAAWLWAASSMGKQDNPLSWVAASHLTLGLLFFLGAMLAATHSGERRDRAWSLVMAAALACSILSMGSFLLAAPVLAWQLWAQGRARGTPTRRAWWWALSGTLVLATLLMLALLLPAVLAFKAPPGAQRNLWGLVATAVQYATALGNLVGWPVARAPLEGIGFKALVAAALLAGVCLPGVRRRAGWVGWIFALTLVHTLLANVHGSFFSFASLIASARYAYLPALFWCAWCGVLVDAALAQAARAERALVIALVLIAAAVYLPIQARSARQTRALFEAHGQLAVVRVLHRELPDFLKALDSHAAAQHTELRVPDVRVQFPYLPHQLRDLGEMHFPQGLSHLEFVPLARWSGDDNQALLRAGESIESNGGIVLANLVEIERKATASALPVPSGEQSQPRP